MTNKNQFPQSSEKVENQPDKLKEARELIGRYNRLTIQPVIELASRAMTMDMLLAAQDLISRHEERVRAAKLITSFVTDRNGDITLEELQQLEQEILNPPSNDNQ